MLDKGLVVGMDQGAKNRSPTQTPGEVLIRLPGEASYAIPGEGSARVYPVRCLYLVTGDVPIRCRWPAEVLIRRLARLQHAVIFAWRGSSTPLPEEGAIHS